MSCYEWERGEIVIPARQWASFVADVAGDKPVADAKGNIEIQCKEEDGAIGEATIRLLPAKRLVVWDVPENNHARDHGRRTVEARRLFKALDRIDWKRGSGGDITANDEYHREDQSAGGGANFLVESYGPNKRKSKRLRSIWR